MSSRRVDVRIEGDDDRRLADVEERLGQDTIWRLAHAARVNDVMITIIVTPYADEDEGASADDASTDEAPSGRDGGD